MCAAPVALQAPEVVSLPTADERKKLEAAGRPLPDPTAQLYDEKVDVWAIGVLAYELMVGRPPFEVEDEKETAMRIMQDNNIFFPAHVPAEAVRFIKVALAKGSAQRPCAAELVQHPWIKPHATRLNRSAQDDSRHVTGGRAHVHGTSCLTHMQGPSRERTILYGTENVHWRASTSHALLPLQFQLRSCSLPLPARVWSWC